MRSWIMSRALLVALIASCGNHSPVPAPVAVPADARPDALALDQDLPRLAARAVTLYEDVARVFTEVGENCTVATARLGELQKTYADVVAANSKVLHDGRAMQLKLALRQYDERFAAAAKAIMETTKTVAACWKQDGFARAFEDLVAAPP